MARGDQGACRGGQGLRLAAKQGQRQGLGGGALPSGPQMLSDSEVHSGCPPSPGWQGEGRGGGGRAVCEGCLDVPIGRRAREQHTHTVAESLVGSTGYTPPPQHTTTPGSESHLTGTSSSPLCPTQPVPSDAHTHSTGIACLPASWALPLPGASGVEGGGHLGRRGGDLRVWAPPRRVAPGQRNPAHCCLLGCRPWGRLEPRMPGCPAPGWGWMGSWKKVVVFIQRGGGQWVESSHKSSFVPVCGAGRAAGRCPHLHPQPPSSIHTLACTSPPLQEAAL